MKKLLIVLAGLALMAAPAAAQIVWNEADYGDAGDLPPTAQLTTCPSGSTVDRINGTSTSGTDVDMYLIHIPIPSAFSATTCGGTAMDTKLILFRINNTGVTYNDDDPSGCGLQSTISGTNITAGNQYYLAVCRYPCMPNSAGGPMWLASPFNTERTPDGPGASGTLLNWTYDAGTTPYDYSIFLTGVRCSGPVATEPSTWGSVKSLFH